MIVAFEVQSRSCKQDGIVGNSMEMSQCDSSAPCCRPCCHLVMHVLSLPPFWFHSHYWKLLRHIQHFVH